MNAAQKETEKYKIWWGQGSATWGKLEINTKLLYFDIVQNYSISTNSLQNIRAGSCQTLKKFRKDNSNNPLLQ